MLDIAASIDQDADLAANIRGEFGHRAGEFVRDEPVRLETPPTEPFVILSALLVPVIAGTTSVSFAKTIVSCCMNIHHLRYRVRDQESGTTDYTARSSP